MKIQHGWLVWIICGLGCHSLDGVPFQPEPPSGEQWWQEGQQAMQQGQFEHAIRCYEIGLKVDPTHTRTHLSLAVAHLENGNQIVACAHLGQFVTSHPDNLTARAFYAELLLRQKRHAEAKAEWERFLADAQEQGDRTLRERIHVHGRLTEIATDEEDDYAGHLNRGIGLYLLACCRADLADRGEGALAPEGLLCKAAGELAIARLLRPNEARPCWYLHEVWRRLAQHHQAQRWLHEAEQAAPFSTLTSAEQRSLLLACTHHADYASRRQ